MENKALTFEELEWMRVRMDLRSKRAGTNARVRKYYADRKPVIKPEPKNRRTLVLPEGVTGSFLRKYQDGFRRCFSIRN